MLLLSEESKGECTFSGPKVAKEVIRWCDWWVLRRRQRISKTRPQAQRPTAMGIMTSPTLVSKDISWSVSLGGAADTVESVRSGVGDGRVGDSFIVV